MKEKACQQMRFTDWFWKVLSPNGLSVLLAWRKKLKIGPQCVRVATAFLFALICEYDAV